MPTSRENSPINQLNGLKANDCSDVLRENIDQVEKYYTIRLIWRGFLTGGLLGFTAEEVPGFGEIFIEHYPFI